MPQTQSLLNSALSFIATYNKRRTRDNSVLSLVSAELFVIHMEVVVGGLVKNR